MAKTNNGLRILVVDEEKSARRFLKAALGSQGYRIFEATDGQSALASLSGDRPDMIILDPALPDRDGVEMIQKIRGHSQIPMMIVSARGQEAAKVAALDAGADDYLTKPFTAGELLARLRAVLRRWNPGGKDPIFKTGGLTFDIGRRLVGIQDQPIRLTPTEYEVLKVLILKAGKVVTHGQLFQEVWNKSEGMGQIGHLLRVTIRNLRSKIEPDPARPTYILTEPSVGYRLWIQP